jgi:DNA-binding transcriptional regulator YhcF (GntR family)
VLVLLTLDVAGQVPLYQQIRDRIVEAIATGEQPQGSVLPSIRQLATDLGINFHTVNKAYDILRQEGLVQLNRKSGAVIARDAASGAPGDGFATAWSPRLRTLLAEAVAQGLSADEIITTTRDVVAGFGHTPPIGGELE